MERLQERLPSQHRKACCTFYEAFFNTSPRKSSRLEQRLRPRLQRWRENNLRLLFMCMCCQIWAQLLNFVAFSCFGDRSSLVRLIIILNLFKCMPPEIRNRTHFLHKLNIVIKNLKAFDEIFNIRIRIFNSFKFCCHYNNHCMIFYRVFFFKWNLIHLSTLYFVMFKDFFFHAAVYIWLYLHHFKGW